MEIVSNQNNNFKILTRARFVVWIQNVPHQTFTDVGVITIDTNMLTIVSKGTWINTWKQEMATIFKHLLDKNNMIANGGENVNHLNIFPDLQKLTCTVNM